MLKKSLRYGGFFLLLITLNLLIITKISAQSKRLAVMRYIIDAIGEQYDTQKQFSNSAAPLVLGEYTAEIKAGDGRVANLKSFFRKYNSPLYNYAELIVKMSDAYQFDYRLLPAIAMQESNLCKYVPDDSHNCWGWGIYGSTVTKFSSYDEAIETVARGIKKNYIDKGLITASMIMEKYTPSSNGSWAHGVNTFLRILE